LPGIETVIQFMSVECREQGRLRPHPQRFGDLSARFFGIGVAPRDYPLWTAADAQLLYLGSALMAVCRPATSVEVK